MSLRLRFVALVVGAVGLTLAALALPGRSIALSEFEASVHAIVREARVEGGPASSDPVGAADPEALAEEVRRTDPGEFVLWVTPDGRVAAANDPGWEGLEGRLEEDGTAVLERTADGGLERLRLAGGRPVVAPDGSPRGRLFHLPSTAPLDAAGDAFAQALDRRLLWWVGGILLGGALLAVVLVGQALAPLQRLGSAARRIADGDLAARAGAGGPPEIRAVAEAFDAMARHLEASEATRRRMIRDVAHDLRTPLTNLRGQIEALQDGLRAADGPALESLHEEAALLQRLVGDLEELARADDGGLGLEPEAVELQPLVQQVLAGFVGSGRLASSSVSTSVPRTLRALADRAALGRALRNVLDNAVVHAPGARLELDAVEAGDQVVLRVRDHGPGVAPEHLDRLSERLYRADEARSRDTGGSGLGLAIAAELLRASGGGLGVEATEGGGLTVELRVPRAP